MRRVVLMLALPLLLLGCGGSTPPDMPDLAGMGDMLKAFGEACSANAECASNVCFVGGNRAFCSLHCAAATQATDCPVPPTSGTCNMQGYCKP